MVLGRALDLMPSALSNVHCGRSTLEIRFRFIARCALPWVRSRFFTLVTVDQAYSLPRPFNLWLQHSTLAIADCLDNSLDAYQRCLRFS